MEVINKKSNSTFSSQAVQYSLGAWSDSNLFLFFKIRLNVFFFLKKRKTLTEKEKKETCSVVASFEKETLYFLYLHFISPTSSSSKSSRDTTPTNCCRSSITIAMFLPNVCSFVNTFDAFSFLLINKGLLAAWLT